MTDADTTDDFLDATVHDRQALEDARARFVARLHQRSDDIEATRGLQLVQRVMSNHDEPPLVPMPEPQPEPEPEPLEPPPRPKAADVPAAVGVVVFLLALCLAGAVLLVFVQVLSG